MSVRFRIRTPGGQELTFASHETFLEFVRSGDLAPDDLVYDAETGSWSSAQTSPAVLEVEMEREVTVDAEASDAAPDETAATADDGGLGVDGILGLELAPVPSLSPEDAAKAFVAKMEAERQASPDYVASEQPLGGVTREDSTSLASMLDSPPPPPATPGGPLHGGRAARLGRSDESHLRPGPTFAEAQRAEAAASAPKPRGQTAPRGSGGGRFVMMAVVVAILGAGAYFGYPLLRDAPVDAGGDTVPGALPVDPVPPPVRAPVIESTPTAVRERALERFLTATQTALRDLPNVPTEWGEGRYFSAPSDFPEVLDVWQTYLSMIRSVRQGDAARYRAAYESALDDAGITGDARVERLSQGFAAFAGAQALGVAHFDRVEALASAAIQTHSALLEAEGLILFDPGGTAGAQEGLGRGAYGRDPDSQQLLDQVLAVLSERLDADGFGPRSGSNVREWVWNGFLDAFTR
jgi:hypothetical protein